MLEAEDRTRPTLLNDEYVAHRNELWPRLLNQLVGGA